MPTRRSTNLRDLCPLQVGLQPVVLPVGKVHNVSKVHKLTTVYTMPEIPKTHGVHTAPKVQKSHAINNSKNTSFYTNTFTIPFPFIGNTPLLTPVFQNETFFIDSYHFDASHFHIPFKSLPAGAYIFLGVLILGRLVLLYGDIMSDGSVVTRPYYGKISLGETLSSDISYHNYETFKANSLNKSVESCESQPNEPLMIPLPEDLDLISADTLLYHESI
jgi:hypothetical protein